MAASGNLIGVTLVNPAGRAPHRFPPRKLGPLQIDHFVGQRKNPSASILNAKLRGNRDTAATLRFFLYTERRALERVNSSMSLGDW